MHKELVEANEQYNDMQDKEKRRNSIILHRAQESNAATSEDRNKEDVKFCLGLFNAINSGVDKEDILKVTRLGKKGEDKSLPPRPMLIQSLPPRPMLVRLTSRLPKHLIIDKLYQLKQGGAKYKAVIVAHDMKNKEID